jgi:hypothetical protein
MAETVSAQPKPPVLRCWSVERSEETRIAETESAFRHVNERIAETAEALDSDATVFVCECADADCQHRLQVPLDEYEEVRTESTHFIVAKGHEESGYERVVEKRSGYAIVEKFKRRLAAMVRRSDPRADN